MTIQSSIEAPSQPEPEQAYGNAVSAAEETNVYDDSYQDEAYDDDDDVDFNLGDGPSTSAAAMQPQHEESTPMYNTTRGPATKEDG